jgi:hypothetical protein
VVVTERVTRQISAVVEGAVRLLILLQGVQGSVERVGSPFSEGSGFLLLEWARLVSLVRRTGVLGILSASAEEGR